MGLTSQKGKVIKISKWIAGVMALGVVCIPAAHAFAQGQREGAERERKSLISIDVTQMPLVDVLEYISNETGIDIVPMPDNLEGEVTVKLLRQPWRDVLDVVAERTGCTVRQEGTRLFVVERPPKITMEFHEADIKVVLDLIARNAGSNIVISEKVQGTVSLNLKDVPWRVALDTIVKTANYAVVEEDRNILRIVSPEDLVAQLETESFPLLYVRPPDLYRAIYRERGPGLGTLGQSGAGVSAIVAATSGTFVMGNPQPVTDPVEEFTLRRALSAIIRGPDEQPKVGRLLTYDDNTNTFFVTGTKTELQEIKRIITEIDVPPQQVHIDVKFIVTEASDLIEQGLRWNDPASQEEDGFIARLIFGTPLVGNTVPNPFNGVATPSFNSGTSTFLGQYPFAFGEGRSAFSKSFSVPAVLDFTQSLGVLRLVDADINSRITQAPSLTTLDRQEATIFVGENVPFAEQRATVDQNGNVTVTLRESEDSPISIGFTLFIRPHVVRGTDEIIMTIIPRTNRLTGTTSLATGGVEGFERFRFSIGLGGIESFIDLPRTQDQMVVTKMMIQDGMTAVIGGLLTEDREEITSKIPILSSIPILGNLFTFRRIDTKVNNLFIFIRPTLLRTSEDIRQLYRASHRRFRDWDPFFQRDKNIKSWQPAGYLDTDKIVTFEDVEGDLTGSRSPVSAEAASEEETGEADDGAAADGNDEAPERPGRTPRRGRTDAGDDE